MKLTETIKAARRCGTPLIAVSTADQQACLASIAETVREANGGPHALLRHDLVRGLMPLNEIAAEALGLIGDDASPDATRDPVAALSVAERFPAGSVLFVMNSHRYIGNDPAVAQAILNLRDQFKANQRTLVLLGASFMLPVELQGDVVVVDEDLPDDAALEAIIRELHESVNLPAPDGILVRSVAAVRGLSAFAAEQVVAMSLTRNGLDLPSCWERKRAAVNQTDGLTMTRPSVTFADCGGMQQAIKYARLRAQGPLAPRVYVRMEEIEKAMAGAFGSVGDSSGVSQYQNARILTAMEEYRWSGMIAVGPAGSGKSLFATACAGEFDAPFVDLDVGAAKDMHVGGSEAKTNALLKVLFALGGHDVFFIATSNKLESLPAELRRRFRAGIWYFDVPTADELNMIWPIQIKAYGLDPKQPRPDSTGWTGAEIRTCCEQAHALGCSLVKASQFVIPMTVSQPDVVEKLRALADGRFFNAAAPGVYRNTRPSFTHTDERKARAVTLPD